MEGPSNFGVIQTGSFLPIHTQISQMLLFQKLKICVQNQFRPFQKLQFQLYPVSQKSHLILYFNVKIQLIAIFQATVLVSMLMLFFFFLTLGQ